MAVDLFHLQSLMKGAHYYEGGGFQCRWAWNALGEVNTAVGSAEQTPFMMRAGQAECRANRSSIAA